MEDLTLSIRLDPDEAFRVRTSVDTFLDASFSDSTHIQCLSFSIRVYGLVDPATGVAFPPLPRSSISTFPDPDMARKMRDVFGPAYTRLVT